MSNPHIQTNLGASNVFNVFGEARCLDLPRLEVGMTGQDVYFVNMGYDVLIEMVYMIRQDYLICAVVSKIQMVDAVF